MTPSVERTHRHIPTICGAHGSGNAATRPRAKWLTLRCTASTSYLARDGSGQGKPRTRGKAKLASCKCEGWFRKEVHVAQFVTCRRAHNFGEWMRYTPRFPKNMRHVPAADQHTGCCRLQTSNSSRHQGPQSGTSTSHPEVSPEMGGHEPESNVRAGRASCLSWTFPALRDPMSQLGSIAPQRRPSHFRRARSELPLSCGR